MLYTGYTKKGYFPTRYLYNNDGAKARDIYFVMTFWHMASVYISGKYRTSVLLRGYCRPIFTLSTANNSRNGRVCSVADPNWKEKFRYCFLLYLTPKKVKVKATPVWTTFISTKRDIFINFFARQFGSGFTGEIELGSEKLLSLEFLQKYFSSSVICLVTLCKSALTNRFLLANKDLKKNNATPSVPFLDSFLAGVTPHVLLQLALCDKRFEALVTRELAVFLLVSAYVIVKAHPTVETYDNRMWRNHLLNRRNECRSEHAEHNMIFEVFQRPVTVF